MKRRVLVTGGSGGIGAAICKRLAREGHHVYVHANRGIEAASEIVADITAAGGKAQSVSFDVTNAEATRLELESVLHDGPIQILINNAGVHADAVFPGMSSDQWHRVIDTSVDGFFNVTQPLLMPMIRTRWGRIVNISSVAALTGDMMRSNYAAAKAGLLGLTKATARELARYGITANAVAPGMIETAITADMPAPRRQALTDMIPLGRFGAPEEVAEVVAWLCSEAAGYVTGQTLCLDGGLHT